MQPGSPDFSRVETPLKKGDGSSKWWSYGSLMVVLWQFNGGLLAVYEWRFRKKNGSPVVTIGFDTEISYVMVIHDDWMMAGGPSKEVPRSGCLLIAAKRACLGESVGGLQWV